MNQVFDHSYGIIPIYGGGEEPLFLLLKQHSGYWSFPKGHPEMGETAQESALREFKEETGVNNCTVLAFPPTSIHYSFTRGDTTHYKTVTLFMATVPSMKVTPQATEIQEHIWLPYEKALTQFNFSSNTEALTAAKNYLDTLKK